jgi:RNA polymerase sigma-70 factor (ECF subfamily)
MTERARFERALEGALPRLYALALRLAGDGHEAEEVLQDASIEGLQAFERLRDPERFEAWMGRIVTTTFLDRRRRARRASSAPLAEDEIADPRGPDDAFADDPGALERFVDDDVMRALDRLPERERAAVLLIDVSGATYGDVGEALGAPIGTVKWLVHEGRQKMRAALEGWARERGWIGGAEDPR